MPRRREETPDSTDSPRFKDLRLNVITTGGAIEGFVPFDVEDLSKRLKLFKRCAVVGAGSNFAEIGEPTQDLEQRSKKEKEKNKEKQVRIASGKNPRKVEGTGYFFRKQITLLIRTDNKDYKAKVFQTGTVSIPGVVNEDLRDGIEVMEEVIKYMSNFQPGPLSIKYIRPIMLKFSVKLSGINAIDSIRLYSFLRSIKRFKPMYHTLESDRVFSHLSKDGIMSNYAVPANVVIMVCSLDSNKGVIDLKVNGIKPLGYSKPEEITLTISRTGDITISNAIGSQDINDRIIPWISDIFEANHFFQYNKVDYVKSSKSADLITIDDYLDCINMIKDEESEMGCDEDSPYADQTLSELRHSMPWRLKNENLIYCGRLLENYEEERFSSECASRLHEMVIYSSDDEHIDTESSDDEEIMGGGKSRKKETKHTKEENTGKKKERKKRVKKKKVKEKKVKEKKVKEKNKKNGKSGKTKKVKEKKKSKKSPKK
jgi:hypothetical protein